MLREVFGAAPASRPAARPTVRARRASTSNVRRVDEVPGGGQDRGLGGEFEGWGGQTQGRSSGSMAVPRNMPDSAATCGRNRPPGSRICCSGVGRKVGI